jgi:TRAP-type C4-dicarboxylate transport system permease small subunit
LRVLRFLDDKLEELLLIGLLIGMAVIMGIQVFCRYALNYSLSWSEELTRYMFIWSCFISISYCIKRWISIKVDQVINMLPKKWYVFAQLFLNVLLFVLFFYLSIHGYRFLLLSIESKQKSPALGLPMPYVQCAPFVGFALATFRSFQQILFELGNVKHMLNHEQIVDQDPRREK